MFTVTRTQCLLFPIFTTAFTSPTSNPAANSSTRKRTRIPSLSSSGRRMTLFTLIYISLAVITLFLSPSAYAERCTPSFYHLDRNGEEVPSAMNFTNSEEEIKKNEMVVREGESFKMSCDLSLFQSVKWTINNREVTPVMQDEWNMSVETEMMDGIIATELSVFNASTKFHAGEYKCTSVCISDTPGANLGFKVTVSIAIIVTVNTTAEDEGGPSEYQGAKVFNKFVAREKRIELVCTAHVSDASMSWFRVNGGKEENMEKDICVGPDLELSDRKKPPQHCKVTHEKSAHQTVIKLDIKRARKEGNTTLKTISDFRDYVCRATSNGNQDGFAVINLAERVSATRSFGHRGLQSLIVVEGDKLEIYCDIHGVDPKDFRDRKAKIEWKKDGKPFEFVESPDVAKIEIVAHEEKGKPYRVGFSYILAETEHRGHYTCDVIKEGENNPDPEFKNPRKDCFATLTYYVRVKDKLGALWPFLGICGEVAILFTIIFIYEKRRSKAELDESDTDGSPDQ